MATPHTAPRTTAAPAADEAGRIPSRPALGAWLAIDVALVSLFALLGRGAHNESLDFAGWLHTASPFLLALTVGWIVALALNANPTRVGPLSGVICAITLALGLVIRVLGGQTAAIPFILVAATVLIVFHAVPRLIAQFVAGRSQRADA